MSESKKLKDLAKLAEMVTDIAEMLDTISTMNDTEEDEGYCGDCANCRGESVTPDKVEDEVTDDREARTKEIIESGLNLLSSIEESQEKLDELEQELYSLWVPDFVSDEDEDEDEYYDDCDEEDEEEEDDTLESNVPDYVIRMIAEGKELDTKISKAIDFLAKNNKGETIDIVLLVSQVKFMIKYSNMLTARLSREGAIPRVEI